MGRTVDVPIPVEAALASRLEDPAVRERVAALVNHELRGDRAQRLAELGAALRRCQAEAVAGGLTEAMVEEELAAWRAERRG
jgi:hypothetical protein